MNTGRRRRRGSRCRRAGASSSIIAASTALGAHLGRLVAGRHEALDDVEQRRAAQARAGDCQLDAPRAEIDRKHTTDAMISLPSGRPTPRSGTGGFLTFCGHHLGVPDAGDRRADRRKHRRAVLVLLLALDLAPRLRRGRCGAGQTRGDLAAAWPCRARGRASPGRPGSPAVSAARGTALPWGLPAPGRRARITARPGSLTNVDEVVDRREASSPNCFALATSPASMNSLLRVRGHRIVRVLRRQVEDRRDQLESSTAPTG